MRRVDADIHDDHPTRSHPGFIQSLDDFGHTFFLLQDFIAQIIGDQAWQDAQGGQVFQRGEGVQEGSACGDITHDTFLFRPFAISRSASATRSWWC